MTLTSVAACRVAPDLYLRAVAVTACRVAPDLNSDRRGFKLRRNDYKIKIEVVVKKNEISSMRYETESCIFCQASASILAKRIKLFSKENVKENVDFLKNSIKNEENYLPAKLNIFTPFK